MNVGICECGNIRRVGEKMCDECKSWSHKIPRQKKVGKKEKDLDLMIKGKCLKCGGKCSKLATLCRECYFKYMGRRGVK